MNSIEKAIKIAVENGWRGSYLNRNHTNAGAILVVQEALLDPLFWQALGKGLGWPNSLKLKDVKIGDSLRPWIYYWHRFIDHLAEGKDAESFFTSLLEHKEEDL